MSANTSNGIKKNVSKYIKLVPKKIILAQLEIFLI